MISDASNFGNKEYFDKKYRSNSVEQSYWIGSFVRIKENPYLYGVNR